MKKQFLVSVFASAMAMVIGTIAVSYLRGNRIIPKDDEWYGI